MRSQKCSKCGTLLDVSRLEKGSKFACATCSTILVVGEAVAVKKSLKESGPAFQPRTAAVEAAPAAPRRSRRAAEETEVGGGAPKSPVPLLAGIGALLVTGIIIAVVATRGDKGGSKGGSQGSGSGEAASAWWSGASVTLSQRDAAGLHALLAEGRSRGFSRDAGFWKPKEDEIFAQVLMKDPQDPEANLRAGRVGVRSYPKFDQVWPQMVEHWKSLPEELQGFVSRHEGAIEGGKDVWYDAAGFASQKALLDQFVQWKREYDSDPTREQVQKGLMAAGQFAKDFGGTPFVARPFILFLASRELRAADNSPEDAKRRETKAAALAPKGKDLAGILTIVGAEFDKRFREPLSLPPLEKSSVLYAWVYDDASAYGDQVRGQTDVFARTEGPALFAPRARWVFGFLADDPAAAEGFGQDLAAAAVQQLQWQYSKEKYDSFYEEWGGIWFNLGLSEYLAGGAAQAMAGKGAFAPANARRAAHIKMVKENGLPFLSVRQIVEQRTLETFDRWVGNYWSPLIHTSDQIPDNARELIGNIPRYHFVTFVAQCWALAQFLNEQEGGKYKKAYLDLVSTALRGRRKPTGYGSGRWDSAFLAFSEILGLKSEPDWQGLEDAYANFLAKVAREAK